MTRTGLVLAVVAALAGDAAAAPQVAPHADIGELAPGVAGSWVITTAAADAAYSFGRAQLVTDVAGSYRLALSWRRLDADVATLEIWLPDNSVVLVKDSGIALFRDNASFPGFSPANLRTQVPSRIELVQSAQTLELHVDGVKLQQWPHAMASTAGRIAVALKAAPRRRARLRVSDVSVR